MNNTSSNTFQAWKDSRLRLDVAIQRYLGRTTELASHMQYSLDNPPGLATAVLDAYNDSFIISSRIEKLWKAKHVLATMRNAPSPLTPVHRLPSDVLHQIFSLIVGQPRYDTYKLDPERRYLEHKFHERQPLSVLSAVCTHWRNIITQTPSFWSHIEVETDHWDNLVCCYTYTESCLKRAQNLPLRLCIYGNKTKFNSGLDRADTLLRSHIQELGVLQVHNFRRTGFSDIISFWLENGRPGSLHTLTLSSFTSPTRTTNPKIELPNRSTVGSFLEPIRVLHLSGVYFDWTSSIYHNLIELRLTNMRFYHRPDAQIKASDLLHALSACPELHTLRLGGIYLRVTGKTPLQPVTLSSLQRLEIDQNQYGLDIILPMIYLGSQKLSVKLDGYSGPLGGEIGYDALRSFLARNSNNIARFFCWWSRQYIDMLNGCLLAVPNISTLIISDLNNNFSTGLVRASQSRTDGVSFCPELHTLYLTHGKFDLKSIQIIFQTIPSIKKLRFVCCRFEPSEEEVLSGLASLTDVRCQPNMPYWFSELV